MFTSNKWPPVDRPGKARGTAGVLTPSLGDRSGLGVVPRRGETCAIKPGIEALPCSARRRAIATFHPSNPNGSETAASEQQQASIKRTRKSSSREAVTGASMLGHCEGWRRLDGLPRAAWSRLERRNGRTDLVNVGWMLGEGTINLECPQVTGQGETTRWRAGA